MWNLIQDKVTNISLETNLLQSLLNIPSDLKSPIQTNFLIHLSRIVIKYEFRTIVE